MLLPVMTEVVVACCSPRGSIILQESMSLRGFCTFTHPAGPAGPPIKAVPQQPLGLVLFSLCREGRARSHF